MIVGIGTDIIEINRIKKIIYKYGEKFKKRCFTSIEINRSEKQFNTIIDENAQTNNQDITNNCTIHNIKFHNGKYSLKILKECKKKPISFEVFGDNYGQMLKQANIINSWGKNVYVKIPVVNSKGLFSGKVINVLSKKGVKLNITAVYTVSQVRKILKNIDL